MTTDDTPAPAEAAPGPEHGYDVFLSYNSADRPAVLEIATRLRDAGIHVFLDVWQLVPGAVWQEKLEETLQQCGSCAVFFGPKGLGPWQNEEMRTALSRRVSNTDFRVIPVLLPNVVLPDGKLPPFVSRTTRVDFRPGLDDADAFDRLLSGIRGVAPQAEGEDADIDIECPFRGLEVFDEDHARFFFGREALTEHLVDQLREDRFLAVLGPSGSGKSSVVRAGLIPELRKGVLSGSADWPVVVVRPGGDPMDALATGLVELTGTNGDAIGTQQSIRKALDKDHGLDTIVRLAIGGAAGTPSSVDHRVVIVVDQFEELFTLLDDDKNRNDFVSALLYASSVPGGPTVVVVTMRADFFGKCAGVPGLAGRMSERDVLVPPMTESELRESMVKPADLVGLQFEKGLVDAILDDLGNEPGSLPLLQHTLLELFNGRHGRWLTNDRYYAIGRVKGAIASRADRIFDSLSPEEQTAARRILLRLTQPGEGTEATRRRAQRDELIGSGTRGTAAEAVIERFAQARLLTTDETSSGQEIVDVAHEALIRGWPKLRGWVEENPTALRVHRELTEAAERWDHEGRKRGYLYSGPRLDEAKALASRYGDDLNDLERTFLNASLGARQRRLILAGGAVALFSVTLAVLGIFSFVQGQQARQAAGEAATTAMLSESFRLRDESPALGQRLAVEALVRGEELGMKLDRITQLTENANEQVTSGAYASLAEPAERGWTDPTGKLLVAGRYDGPQGIYATGDGRRVGGLPQSPSLVEFSRNPDAGVFAVTYDDGTSELRRNDDFSAVETPAKMGSVFAGTGPGDKAIAISYGPADDPTFKHDQPAEIRSIVDGAVLSTLRGPADIIPLNPRSLGLVAMAYHDGGVDVVRLSDGTTYWSIEQEPADLSADLTVSEASPAFVLGSGGDCKLYSVATKHETDIVDAGGECSDVTFDADGRTLVVYSNDVFMFDVESGKQMLILENGWRFVTASTGSPPNFVVVTMDADATTQGETRVYRTSDQEIVWSFEEPLGSSDDGATVGFSPDGSLLYLPTSERNYLVEMATGNTLLTGHFETDEFGDPTGVIALGTTTFSPDGKWLIIQYDDKFELRTADDPTQPGQQVANAASFWPGSEGALVVGETGLFRAGADGELEDLLRRGPTSMEVVTYDTTDEEDVPVGPATAAIVAFASPSGDEGPTAVLTPDGQVRELEVTSGSPFFSDDPDHAYVVVDDSTGVMGVWRREDTSTMLGALDAYTVIAWDPNGGWLATSTATGQARLVSMEWLKTMAASGGTRGSDWLENQVCTGPPRRLVDDAALTKSLGEPPHSCRDD